MASKTKRINKVFCISENLHSPGRINGCRRDEENYMKNGLFLFNFFFYLVICFRFSLYLIHFVWNTFAIEIVKYSSKTNSSVSSVSKYYTINIIIRYSLLSTQWCSLLDVWYLKRRSPDFSGLFSSFKSNDTINH